jgi:trehalose 6-phosphate synthase/phosphatase
VCVCVQVCVCACAFVPVIVDLTGHPLTSAGGPPQEPNNTVFVISGKSKGALDQYFAHMPGVGIAAEHGFFYRWGGRTWEALNDYFDGSWKPVAKEIMSSYTQRVFGTYVVYKDSAMVWQFSDADLEFGPMQAKEMQDQLKAVLSEHHVEVVRGKDYVEVRPKVCARLDARRMRCSLLPPLPPP